MTLRGGPGQLPLARKGVTAIHRLPPTLLTLTLEGLTLVPNELSGFGVKYDRAAPHDLQKLSLTRIKYESGGTLKDFRDNLESTRIKAFGPRPPSDSDSPPPLVSADEPTGDSAQGGSSFEFSSSSSSRYASRSGGSKDWGSQSRIESTKSPWGSSYHPEQLGTTYGSWLDRSSWTGDVKYETGDKQDDSESREIGEGGSDSSPTTKLDLRLFLGAGKNILRIFSSTRSTPSRMSQLLAPSRQTPSRWRSSLSSKRPNWTHSKKSGRNILRKQVK